MYLESSKNEKLQTSKFLHLTAAFIHFIQSQVYRKSWTQVKVKMENLSNWRGILTFGLVKICSKSSDAKTLLKMDTRVLVLCDILRIFLQETFLYKRSSPWFGKPNHTNTRKLVTNFPNSNPIIFMNPHNKM